MKTNLNLQLHGCFCLAAAFSFMFAAHSSVNSYKFSSGFSPKFPANRVRNATASGFLNIFSLPKHIRQIIF
jgi:hypothetical protein